MVNCFAGLSRSATVIASYLLVKHGKSALEAITMIRSKRAIWPRKQQLAYLSQIHNKIHGFSGIEVWDDGIDVYKNALKKVVVGDKK